MKNKKDRSEWVSRIDRRDLLVGGAAVGAMTLGLTDFGGIKMANAEDIDLKELETANETLVNNFCRDWSLRDADALANPEALEYFRDVTELNA
jgi:hypothetical protein